MGPPGRYLRHAQETGGIGSRLLRSDAGRFTIAICERPFAASEDALLRLVKHRTHHRRNRSRHWRDETISRALRFAGHSEFGTRAAAGRAIMRRENVSRRSG